MELLEEEGTPAVFDRYSNSFLKIYFPIPEGRENEIARKVLIAHLQAGNSYGIRLKEKHCKFLAARARPVGRGARARSARTGTRPCSKAGKPRCTELMRSVKHLVIGAGVHGLSTAWHLAEQGEQVLVVDKTGVAAGASGIACGVVRNNYFQPAMSELMAACVEIWESDPETLHYFGSGYIALGDGAQEADLTTVFERQQRIGYDSELITGEADVAEHMRALFGDWRAPGLSVCLHEHQGGFAFNRDSMLGLASKAVAAGASIEEGVEVTGFELDESGAVKVVETSTGAIAVEQVVVAVGPWVASLWELLGLPRRLEVAGVEQEMWTYWYLQEGEIDVDPRVFVTSNGSVPPVLHVDSHAPLHADDGSLVTDEQWGVYFKQDKHERPGRRGAAAAGSRVPGRPLPHRQRRARLPGPLVRGAVALHGALRGVAAALPPGALGRRGRLHRRQLPGVRLHAPERVRGRRLQPRLQDDRRGPRDRPGARRRALGAAAPVPLRALRDRGPAPGVELAVPVVLVVGGGVNGLSAAWGLARAGRRRRAGRQGPPRRRRVRDRRRDRAQLLPRGRDHRARAAVGGDVRGGPGGVRVPAGRLPGGGAGRAGRGPGGDPRAARARRVRVGAGGRGAECREYLRWSWPDWEAPVEALLHERRGGWADAMQTVRHLASRARAAGVEIREGVEVVGFEDGRALTSDGPIEYETLVLAAGPWAAQLLDDLDLRYWKAQEGEFALAGAGLSGRAGSEAPVVHLDQSGPLRSDRDGRVLVDGPWGIYFRMGRTGTGITGGGLPVLLDSLELDPYGPDNPAHAAEPAFEEFFTSGLAAAMRRFRGHAGDWRVTAAGGIVAHTRRQLPDLRLGRRGRLRDRGLGARLQDAGDRAAGGGGDRDGSRRPAAGAVQSGRASSAASCWRRRRGRTRGPRPAGPRPR